MALTPIKIPTNCPCCDSTLVLVNDQLFCKNVSCSAQLSKKLEHFVKVLGIKGLGPKSLEKLALSDISEIFYLEQADFAAALGSDKLAEKLLEEVEKSKASPLHVVIASFSIPLVGETISKKLCSVISHIDELTAEKCKEAGIGEKATNNLLEWYNTDLKEIREFLPFSFKSSSTGTSSNSVGTTVCITGKLTSYKTKALAHEALTAAGYTPVDSVTKALGILVDEANDGSSKRVKADQYGIKIIHNLKSFLES